MRQRTSKTFRGMEGPCALGPPASGRGPARVSRRGRTSRVLDEVRGVYREPQSHCPTPITSLFLLLLLLMSCGPATPTSLSEPDIPPLLGKDSVVLGEVWYACGSWKGPGKPVVDQIIADLFFGMRGPLDDDDRPSAEALASVESLGGRVLHQFHFPAVRAVVPSHQAERLFAESGVSHVRTVPYSDRFDWKVAIALNREATGEDVDLITAMGGEVLHSLSNPPILLSAVPDQIIPDLRSLPQVSLVSALGVFCPDG